MKHLINDMMSGTAPLVIIIANEKGGQGKSLTGLAVADYAHLCQIQLGVAQIDNQARLSKALDRKVLTIDAVPGNARRDPAAEARSFTPLYGFLQKDVKANASILIDVGANQALRLAHWSGLVDLEEDLAAWGFKTVIVVPFVAEAEGIRQAGKTAELLGKAFTNAHLVLIENGRDGSFEALHPASDTALAYREVIEPLKSSASVLTMPAVEAGSWRLFEAGNSRLIHVAGMPIGKVMALTGLPQPKAKISRGDVAAWAGTFFAELDRVLPWNQGGDDA
ncbi:P-loop NTPase family protein [Devosia faecipullorum]|uniref:hypothetical protein n=1 Tax=Devosia faecipullorum TaxID=2755039 RepID=UPI00187B1DC9|nr:hypothetical protein [Devosia faecipullorum]MBE7734516.1 hypothetical protein [Devosia faecipullorum]